MAGPVIAGLKALRPDLEVAAVGGTKMAAAGAKLLEQPTDRAVMLIAALSHAAAHCRRLSQLKKWLTEHPIDAFVPVDSPAANWSICRLVRRLQPQAKIVHLVAPQVWAWAGWRIGKLRRLTDHMLCLLPFEPKWFEEHGVPATFVGHPLIEQIQPPGSAVSRHVPPGFNRPGPIRVAMLPGSRRAEIRRNGPVMLQALAALRNEYPELQVTVAAVDQWAADEMTPMVSGLGLRPESAEATARGSWLDIAVGRVDEILAWADLVLVVSGTATLHTALHGKPMVVVYRANRFLWHVLGRWIVNTRTFSLPNLVAESLGRGTVVPEFVPYFDGAPPLTAAMRQLMDDPRKYQQQAEALKRVRGAFEGYPFGRLATQKLMEAMASSGR